jgi:hypothetical protein
MPDLPAASQLAAAEGVLAVGTVYWLSLHSTDPGTTGANEVTNSGGSSYQRQAITFVASGGNELISGGTDAAQTFNNMPYVNDNLWFGIWTAQSGGTFKWGSSPGSGGNVTGPVAAGATVSVGSGSVQAQIT